MRYRPGAIIPLALAALVLCMVCGAFVLAKRSERRYKIGIVHSYEKSYPDAARYRKLLEKELEANGLSFEIREYFLNCDELLYYDELARSSNFISELADWGADAVAVFNNQAAYSFLKCDNPRLRDLKVVFSGVYHPDLELIRDWPNVTGFVDIPDYAATARMIERIMDKSRIVVMCGDGMIERRMWRDLVEQCEAAGIETYEGDVLAHLWAHRVVRTAQEERGARYNEQIDTTVIMRMMSERMPLRTVQQIARGSETYLMLISRTYNTIDAPEFFYNPSFAVINEGFGSNPKMLGGYFTPLETQMQRVAQSIARRLRGEMPERQIEQIPKEYVLSWQAMQRCNLSPDGLPPEYRVMYVPLSVRYRMLLLAGTVVGAAVVLLLIGYLVFSLAGERRRKRKALRDLLIEHETLKLAIEGGTTYAWRMKQGRFRFDSHFYRMIGREKEPLTLDRILEFVHPEDRERLRAGFMQDGASERHKGEYLCRFDGAYRWWEFRYSELGSNGSERELTGLLQNIQEVKDREHELIRARRIAEQAELKQSFLNNVSHEIRTPLNAIVGFSNLLAGTPDLTEDEKQEFIATINRNNTLLLQLIDDLLELSRIESGAAAFSAEQSDLRTLLQSYYRTFRMQMKPGLDFLLDLPQEQVAVKADPFRLQQVVTNFLSNANKFTDKGYVKLGFRYMPDRGEVCIYVEDTGRGIAPEMQEIVFTRFYKYDEFAQGTGLGLSICRSIADRMQGRIELRSEVGRGSTFSIILPAVCRQADAQSDALAV